MDFLQLVEKNRSYRGFDESAQVSRGQLERLVEYALSLIHISFYALSDASFHNPLTQIAHLRHLLFHSLAHLNRKFFFQDLLCLFRLAL